MKVKVKSLSCIWLFATPWTVAYQAPPSMGFSRHEYWSGLPFPSPGDLCNPGIKLRSPALQADALPSEPQGSPSFYREEQILSGDCLSKTSFRIKCVLMALHFISGVWLGVGYRYFFVRIRQMESILRILKGKGNSTYKCFKKIHK